ncbi:glycine cleavage system protein GcvH [Candidatus Woesearchaeota archaeon]|nr:glycine cleavage system protein GcvH [Candidatus Woesearchaeota archaeon]
MANIPTELKYSKDHEWVRVQEDTATVGITDHAQKQLTDIVFVELPEKGKQVEKGKNLANVESVKSVSDVFAPLSGEVTRVNEKLADSPETLNKDCYGEGWIAKIKLKDKSELHSLMSAEEYRKQIEND